jgi:hypothetical protein
MDSVYFFNFFFVAVRLGFNVDYHIVKSPLTPSFDGLRTGSKGGVINLFFKILRYPAIDPILDAPVE